MQDIANLTVFKLLLQSQPTHRSFVTRQDTIKAKIGIINKGKLII